MNRKKFLKLKRLKQQLGEIDCMKNKGYPKTEY